jgi:metal-responsive CopG/Arc/MetJ family transcriptional regulator
MKTAISIPDDIFQEAEETAKEMGLSRSQLYVVALAEYLKSRRRSAVTAALNQVYDDGHDTLDPRLAAMQSASLDRDEW